MAPFRRYLLAYFTRYLLAPFGQFLPVEQRPQEDIVFLVSIFSKIKEANLEFVFTDMNAKIAIVKFFDNESGFNKLQWDIIQSRFWFNEEGNISRQDYKQAEFLVRNHVPASCISSIVVKSDKRKAHFEDMLSQMGLSIKVFVDKKCKLYY